MARRAQFEVPAAMAEVARQFEGWRKSHSGRRADSGIAMEARSGSGPAVRSVSHREGAAAGLRQLKRQMAPAKIVAPYRAPAFVEFPRRSRPPANARSNWKGRAERSASSGKAPHRRICAA